MSLIGSIESTKSYLTHTSRTSYRPLLDFLYPPSTRLGGGYHHGRRRALHQQPRGPRTQLKKDSIVRPRQIPSDPANLASIDSIFINALLKAGTCRRHLDNPSKGKPKLSSLGSTTSRRGQGNTSHLHANTLNRGCIRSFSTGSHARRWSAAGAAATAELEELSHEEAMSLVDLYDDSWLSDPGESRETEEKISRDKPRVEGRDERDTSKTKLDATLLINSKGGGGPTEEPQQSPNENKKQQNRTLERLFTLLQDPESSHEEIFSLYRALSPPRAIQLPYHQLRRLLQHLARVEFRNTTARIRYMSVLDDLKAANRSILPHEWNTAINMAAKSMKVISGQSVQSALVTWRQMEQEAGVKSDHVTFTILFDIATKAEKFVLAEKIHQEMADRELQADRIHLHTLIWHHGKRMDGIGVRRVYRQLVDKGYIVDTYTLNTVIVSLLRANEPSAAEHVFGRMKQLHARKTSGQGLPLPLPPNSWRSIREFQRILNKLIRPILPHDPPDAVSMHPNHLIPIAPDARTYKKLIEYYSHKGSFERIVTLLSEFPVYNVNPSGGMFYHLLSAFAEHGGTRYSAWTLERLEIVWAATLVTVDSRSDQTKDALNECLLVPMVKMTLRAFAKCGSASRVMEVWNDITNRCQFTDEELNSFIILLKRLLPGRNLQ